MTDVTPWICGEEWYRNKMDSHKPLWSHLGKWSREMGIRSILEVGGGCGLAAEVFEIDKYCCIDVNHVAIGHGQSRARDVTCEDTFLCADWCEIDTSRWRDKFDAVLGCFVAEHCSHYKVFIEQALAIRPRWIVVSFFQALTVAADKIERHTSDASEWSRSGAYWENQYSASGLLSYLSASQLPWKLESIGRSDTLLTIGPLP